jgi:predicted flap endonuclease-1-like 5' DNA nuclease
MVAKFIEKIEGIGPAFGANLQAAGIKTTEALLDKSKDPKGRKALAAETGIDESRILKWANMADLMRIKGVGEEYSELLEAAGVDTVKELKMRNAANLHAAMKAHLDGIAQAMGVDDAMFIEHSQRMTGVPADGRGHVIVTIQEIA